MNLKILYNNFTQVGSNKKTQNPSKPSRFNFSNKNTNPAFKSSYVPAKTVGEAKSFAVNHLGMKIYEIDRVDVANWVNKALIYLKKVTGGETLSLENVRYGRFGKLFKKYQSNTTASMSSTLYGNYNNYRLKHVLNINEEYIDNINQYLSQGRRSLINIGILEKKGSHFELGDNYTTKYENEFETLMNKDIRSMSFEDKMALDNFYNSLLNYARFKMSDIDSYVKKFFRMYKNNPHISSYLTQMTFKFSPELKFEGLNALERKVGANHNVVVDGKYQVLFHEMGHMMHSISSPRLYFGDYPQMDRYFRNNLYTASKVSQYSTTSYKEFIAETFVKMALRMNLPSDVKDLYDYFGGPKL